MTDDGPPPPYLGVSASLTGRRWTGPSDALRRSAEALAQATGTPLPLAQILAGRGVGPDEVAAHLAPTLRALLPDPLELRDMDRAADRLVRAVERSERVAIFGDYDVDGAASSALLHDWFAAFGQRPMIYIPDRIDEGYGPNVPAMAELAAGHDLVICVDCGTLSFDALEAAEATDVIVLDHHLALETLPPALAVVNPNRQDESGQLSHLCAAAVVFLTLVEAGRRLKAAGRSTPDLLQAIDLVALATVADVAPLVGVNRAFVRTGLQVMARRGRTGLRALADVAGLDTAPTAYHLGYLLGPRINAGGRIGKADLGARLLTTADPDEARALAERLDALNHERREIEVRVQAEAMAQIEARGGDDALAWAAGPGWHPGVVGIVAARIKEATNLPAIVIGTADGIGKGSGRSVPGIDLGAAIQRLAREGLLQKGGGHRMAAGLTVEEDRIEPAMARLAELLRRQGVADRGPATLACDGIVMAGAASAELIADLDSGGPYGASAPAPRLALPDMRIRHARMVGKGHLKLTLQGEDGTSLDAIAFGAAEGPLAALAGRPSGRFHVAGRLELNTWQGRQRVQLRLDDAAEVQSGDRTEKGP